MIPLSRWLSEDPRALLRAELFHGEPVERDRLAIVGDSTELDARLANAREQTERELQQEAAAMISAAREEEQQKSEGRESAVVAEWTARCAEVAGLALSGLKQELQKSIGKALDDVLQPLLPFALRKQATAKLFELLDREFEAAGDEILEVRAPAGMHDSLRLMLDQKGLQAILTAYPKIEVLSGHGPSRFESLADAWASFVLPREP